MAGDRRNPKLVIFVDDWLSSAYVDGLSLEMEAVFLRLLMFQVRCGTDGIAYEGDPGRDRNGRPKGATNGAERGAKRATLRASKMAPKRWPDVLRLLDDQFPVGPDGRRRNAKLHKLLMAAEEASETARQNGSKGGRPRNPGVNPDEKLPLSAIRFPQERHPEEELPRPSERAKSEGGKPPRSRPRRRDLGTNPRAEGTNPRATGTNPKALGTNPRALGTNPRATRDPDEPPPTPRANPIERIRQRLAVGDIPAERPTAPPPPPAGSAPIASTIDRAIQAVKSRFAQSPDPAFELLTEAEADREDGVLPKPFTVVDPKAVPIPDLDEQARRILDLAQQGTGHADFARSRSHGSVRSALAFGEVTFEQACTIVDRLGQDVRAAGTKPPSLFKIFSDHSQRDFYLRVWTPPTPSEVRPEHQTFAERDKANFDAEVQRHMREFAEREARKRESGGSA